MEKHYDDISTDKIIRSKYFVIQWTASNITLHNAHEF